MVRLEYWEKWIPGSSCGRPGMTARHYVNPADYLLALRLPAKFV
jgi:hypothetical protein